MYIKIKNVGKTQRKIESSKLPDLLSATVLSSKDKEKFLKKLDNPMLKKTKKTKVKKLKKIKYRIARNRADKAFQQFIRNRDKDKPCITCGKPTDHPQAGHFVSRTRFATRYDERNAHLQCPGCNLYKKGNLILYTLKMIEVYGKTVVDELLKKAEANIKYTVDELLEIEKKYIL
jgi:hypothetical protein